MPVPWSNAHYQPAENSLIVQLIEAYRATLQIAGLATPVSIANEIELVVSQVEAQPGPFLAFCQGDQNLPGGCLRAQTKLRLLDFDQSGLRHALLEGMPGRMTWGVLCVFQ